MPIRKSVYKPKHPLATKWGSILISRANLYSKLRGENANCFWCKMPLFWSNNKLQRKKSDALCVDHLDNDTENNDITNLVPSCRQCNANRKFGGRKKPKRCKECNVEFLPAKRTTLFCSNKCSSKQRPKRGTKTQHGTRSRYNYGCRCSLCKNENIRAWRKWYYSKK